MATNGLILVYQGGTHKISQFMKFDSYMECQGLLALNFLHKIINQNLLTTFINKCSKLTHTEPSVLENLYREFGANNDGVIFDRELSKKLYNNHPQLKSNFSTNILDFVLETNYDYFLIRDYEFIYSDCCFWSYVIDLDAKVFEVYKMKRGSFPKESRFFSNEKTRNYQKLVASFNFDELPPPKIFLELAINV